MICNRGLGVNAPPGAMPTIIPVPRAALLQGHYRTAVNNHWTGLLDWTTGLDYWTTNLTTRFQLRSKNKWPQNRTTFSIEAVKLLQALAEHWLAEHWLSGLAEVLARHWLGISGN